MRVITRERFGSGVGEQLAFSTPPNGRRLSGFAHDPDLSAANAGRA